jgi:hypothetical protein
MAEAFVVKIGSLILNPEIVWEDKSKWVPIYQGSALTLGGKTIIQAIAAVNGRPVTLTATQTQGWLTLTQVNALLVMAAVPGAVYVFQYGSFTTNVMFRSHEPPAVEMTPLVDGAEPCTYHSGTIKLITI